MKNYFLVVLLLSLGFAAGARADLTCSLTKGGAPLVSITAGSIEIATVTETVDGKEYQSQWRLDNSFWMDCDHKGCHTRHLSIDQDYPSFALDVEWESHACCVKNALSYLVFDDQNCLNCDGATKEVVYCSGDLN